MKELSLFDIYVLIRKFYEINDSVFILEALKSKDKKKIKYSIENIVEAHNVYYNILKSKQRINEDYIKYAEIKEMLNAK